MSKPIEISQSDYIQAAEDQAGVCLACREITNEGGCEPDAENYECDFCGARKVMGVEQALLVGHLTFK